jgi:hypothetical protein
MDIEIRKKRMLQMRKKGVFLNEIGKEFGLSHERVRQIIGTQFKPLTAKERAVKIKQTLIRLRGRNTYKSLGKRFGIYPIAIINTISEDVKKRKIKYSKYALGWLKCSRCKKVMHEDKFSPSNRHPNVGRMCRVCAGKSALKYIDYNDYKKGGKYYEHQKARSALNQALRKGKIKKGECFLKGDNCFGRIEAHHHLGYDKKHYYDVLWVCSQHHTELDKINAKTTGYKFDSLVG